MAFNSGERLNWDFVPRARQGVSLKQMSPEQRRAAVALLKSSVSAAGFAKADAILRLEEVLHAVSGSSIRDPELYYFTVFGEPSGAARWGLSVEGHHVSQHACRHPGRISGNHCAGNRHLADHAARFSFDSLGLAGLSG